ncbi:MAG: PAS domain S-box protein [Melioribacteraceae bacterium]|nr:PAS domain S-box protein [Melioribacteraceae bacterium]
MSLKNIVDLICSSSGAYSGLIIRTDRGKSSILTISENLLNDDDLQEFSEELSFINDLNEKNVHLVEAYQKMLSSTKQNYTEIFTINIEKNVAFLLVLMGKSNFWEKKDKNDFILKITPVIINVIENIRNIDNCEAENYFCEKEKLISISGEMMFNLDASGYFIIINKIGADTLGFAKNQIIGKHFLDFIDDDKKADIALEFQKILESEEIVEFNTLFVDRFGKRLDYTVKARSIRKDEKITGLFGYAQNLSDKIKDKIKVKELNAKLIEANRLISIERDRAEQQISVLEELNRLKNDFISNVSHELRTPLASIVGFAETITSDPDLPREIVLEFCEVILNEGKRLAKLINEILDFSRLELGADALHKTTFDFVPALRETLTSHENSAAEKGVILNSEIPEAEILINGDQERIIHAVNNIISNAIKFTDKGGRITIYTRDFLKEVELIVSDTGIGIPEKDIANLFHKFSKVNRPGAQVPGAGFGLATVKQIIEMHKGLIKVNSEVDKGTSFVIRLPKNLEQ